jgi:hypothetical protein
MWYQALVSGAKRRRSLNAAASDNWLGACQLIRGKGFKRYVDLIPICNHYVTHALVACLPLMGEECRRAIYDLISNHQTEGDRKRLNDNEPCSDDDAKARAILGTQPGWRQVVLVKKLLGIDDTAKIEEAVITLGTKE